MGHLVSQQNLPLRPALRNLSQRLCRRGDSMHWLSVGRQQYRRPVEPHTDCSLTLCTPSMSSEAVRLKGPSQPSYVWDDGGVTLHWSTYRLSSIPSMHTARQCCFKSYGPPQGPLVGPWGVVHQIFDYELTLVRVRQPSTNFHHFRTLKTQSNRLRNTNN